MDLWIFAEHHVRVENAIGVEQSFELPHQLVGIAAPFQFNERRHVASGAVFSLQRTAELHRHQLRHVVHERLIACDFFRAVEALGEDEVQIAFQGVSEKDRFVVVMFVEQFDQAVDADGQLFDREGDVFDDHRGAGLAHGADGGKGVFADGPETGVFLRVFGEVDLLFHRERLERRHDLRQLLVQQSGRRGAGFDQQGAGIVRQMLYENGHAGFVLYRAQAAPVQQFHGRHRLAFQHGDRIAAGLDIREHNQGRGLVRVVDHGVVGHGTDEPERALGAHQQVAQDIHRLVEIHQGIERQAGGIFQTVFVANFRSQLGVCPGLAAQDRQAFQQRGVALAKRRDAGGILGVETTAIGQHQTNAGQGVIGVLRGAAAHAAGIVGDDPADLAGVDRGRVRTDLASERCQPGVGLGADHPRLQADLRALAADLATVPVIPQHDQHRVADRLAGQAGAGGAESHRHLIPLRQLQQCHHFVFGLDADHQLRNQTIETGIGAEGQGRQRVVETSLLGNQLLCVTQESGR
ncbi:hypothetical protein D3C86_1233610 [compost metagenome]